MLAFGPLRRVDSLRADEIPQNALQNFSRIKIRNNSRQEGMHNE
jgi:hypothetical protein